MYKKILLAVDGSAACESALHEAIDLAAANHASIRVLHVVTMPCADASYGDTAQGKEFLENLMLSGSKLVKHAIDSIRSHGVEAESVIVELGDTSVADEILAQAHQWHASIIVLGTHPLAVAARVGAETREVLADSTIPVLSLNAKDEKTLIQSAL